ncbi:exo-alpha-sialidase [Dermabacter vaginalis]|uniref:exo-alpha-sialidase n=1 Tax=Dermabacter vaginalis TaxID=1630135 RepID=A0A1B0ZKK0_9MICO|nr:exo-alpha-sialidase [Dermabacter vaginalis]ANP28544.1 exo-alpha-sialidase [Dermabacter vaginalis]
MMNSPFSPYAKVLAFGATVALTLGAPLSALAAPSDTPESAGASAAESSFTSQRIAMGGEGGFGNYRIPAVMQLRNGDVLLAYDGRPTGTDAPGPNSILMRRSTDGGKTFGPQTVIAAGEKSTPIHGYSDPSFVYDEETGDLFAFFVHSKDTGFWNSQEGHDDADRKVMSAALAVSKDNGKTWDLRSLTATVKPEGVRATFATSGHGIQLKNGAHKGRLVQQYAGAFTDGTVRAYSVYSDDHGATWNMGTPVGTKMDENKVVELADGTLMMNSRAHDTHTARWVAYSKDGGETWSEPTLDHTLTDPRNNASIIRMNPAAAPETREAQELLFSNANSSEGRKNGSIRYSCDSGKTWPTITTFNAGPTSYSDLVALQDGTFGVFYESADSEQRYGSFTRDFVNPFCAAFGEATADIDAGSTSEVTFTLRNDDTRDLISGTAVVDLPKGWNAPAVTTPTLKPGESTTITLTVSAPAWASKGEVHGEVRIDAGDTTVRGDLDLTIVNAAPNTLGATIVGRPGDPDRDLSENPYKVGDEVPYTFRVDSTANVTETVTPVSGNLSPLVPEGPGNCRWRHLKAGDGYTCASPRYTVTEEDLARGYFIPESQWELTGTGLDPVTITVTGEKVWLVAPIENPVVPPAEEPDSTPVEPPTDEAGEEPSNSSDGDQSEPGKSNNPHASEHPSKDPVINGTQPAGSQQASHANIGRPQSVVQRSGQSAMSSRSLPRTGTSALLTAAAAAGVLTAGIAMTLGVRQRRQR